MHRPPTRWLPFLTGGLAVTLLGLAPRDGQAACCYFSAKDKDIQQPAQKVFITWDARKKEECFTVQPRFEGNARDFGMVIPTPSQPRLSEMPRDFFKELAVYTILKQRQFPASSLLAPRFVGGFGGGFGGGGFRGGAPRGGGGFFPGRPPAPRKPEVKVVETGLVGSLDYKIIKAGRADDLYKWLKDHKYSYKGDEATLDFYIKKKWFFTVMKIDTMQMKKNKDGSFTGDVTPTRFQFTSEKLIYPLKITQLSVKKKTEALFYVQTSYKVDLPEDMTYQFQWIPMLDNARGWYGKGSFGTYDLPGKADDWLKAIKPHKEALLKKGRFLGFTFQSGQRPKPNRQGRIATTLEWAKRLTRADIQLLKGEVRFSEQVPDVDEGFTAANLQDGKKSVKVTQVINERLAKSKKDRPAGYHVRSAPVKDVKQLKILTGHLQEGQFLTKFRKTFTRDEMNADLLMVPAKVGDVEDKSEYEESLPTSPP
jgi:hypothetical protein